MLLTSILTISLVGSLTYTNHGGTIMVIGQLEGGANGAVCAPTSKRSVKGLCGTADGDCCWLRMCRKEEQYGEAMNLTKEEIQSLKTAGCISHEYNLGCGMIKNGTLVHFSVNDCGVLCRTL